MSLKLEEIKSLIKEALPDAEISIQDLAGDDNHYSATIKSKIFSGKTLCDAADDDIECAMFTMLYIRKNFTKSIVAGIVNS